MEKVSLHSSTGELFIDRMHDAFLAGDSSPGLKGLEAEQVRRLQYQYAAIARGDFGPLIAGLADDVVVELHGPADFPVSGRSRGRAAAAEMARRNYAQLKDQQAEILSLTAQGDTVVVFARETGAVRATDRRYDIHWVQLFTFRDGKISCVRGVAADTTPAGR